MDFARPLPSYLVKRYRGWKATTFTENSAWYRRLADEGQRPRTMVISCCDSRVQVTALFEADQGEFFVHRNIANLVPPFHPDGGYRGTSAAIEYAVVGLRVAHLVVLGHSGCGGVQACYDACLHGEQDVPDSFVRQWLEILKPGWDRVTDIAEGPDRRRRLEEEAVVISMENLMTFPFVKSAIEADTLSMHGLWTDIGSGALHVYQPATDRFEAL